MKYAMPTEARKNITRLVDAVRAQNTVVAIERGDRPEVLIGTYPEQYNNILAPELNFQANSTALDFLRDEPDLYNLSDLKKHITKQCE